MNMTDKDLRKLADMVAAKIVLELFGDAETRANTKQQFEDDFKQTDHLASIFADMSDEEMLIGELARLQTILMIYEDKEEYEKAARILKKLKIIQGKLGKL
jgi:lipopolysaccharide biosynthesis regulator YciM